jgi:hypothetical protein
MRERIKGLKYDIPVFKVLNSQNEASLPEPDPSVKISKSNDGLVIKLTFNNEASANLVETGIYRLLGRHGIREENK